MSGPPQNGAAPGVASEGPQDDRNNVTNGLENQRKASDPISTAPDLLDLFGRVLADSPGCAVVQSEHGKLVLPLGPGTNLLALWPEHVAGSLGIVTVVCADGRTWPEREARALAVRMIDSDGNCWVCALDFDAGTGGHACATSVHDAQAAACYAYELLVSAGFTVLLAVSGGGDGRHVWCFFPAAVPAAFAVFLVALVARQVKAKFPTAHIDLRPQSDRGHGSAITLPGGGWSRAPGGGRVLFVHRPSHAVALASLDGLLRTWDIKREQDEAERRLRDRQRVARVPRGGRAGDVESKNVSLAAVAEIAGEFVRSQGAEIHVRCPSCPGTVKINPDKGAWACFQCDVGGVGEAASYLLARWLSKTTDPSDVFGVLRAASREVSNV